MEETHQTQGETLKDILESFEKASTSKEELNTTDNKKTMKEEKNNQNLNNNNRNEIEWLKKKSKKSSILAKREKLKSDNFELELEKKLQEVKIVKKKLKIASNDKAILLSRIGFMNQKIINKEDFDLGKNLKKLNQELRSQKSKLTIRENEYNLSLIQSEKFESEAEMWKGLYTKTNKMLQNMVESIHHDIDQNPNSDFENEKKSENFLEKILLKEEDFISHLSIFEKKGDVEVAQKVFENDLKKLKQVLDKQNELEENLKTMKDEFNEKEKSMDEKYSKLLESYQKAKDKISRSENFNPSSISETPYTQDEIKKVLERFSELKNKYFSLRKTLKKYSDKWTKNLKDSSKKDHQVIKLRKTYQKLEKNYVSLEEKLKEKLEKEIEEKIDIRDKIIEDQGFQIQNLLYQNHKLRQYIHNQTGEFILPMDHQEFSKDILKERRDRKVYNTIEEQVEQITKLRKKLYLMSSRMEETIEKKQKAKEESGRNETQKSYSHPYNSLLKRYQKSKKEVLKLQKETSTWKETTQRLLSEKSELQTKYRNLQNSSKNQILSLKSKVESYENLKKDLLQKLTSVTNQNSNLEINRIQNQQKMNQYKSDLDKLEKVNKELRSVVDKLHNETLNEEKIWEKITIVLEDPDISGGINQERDELIELLQELRQDFSKEVKKMNSKVKQDILISQYKEHCSILEKMMKNLKLNKKGEIEKIKNSVRKISNSMKNNNLEDLVTSISLSTDLQSFCPTLLCLRLNKMMKSSQHKYEKLRGEMLDKNTIQKEKELEISVKELTEKLSELTKAYELETKEKSELMKMIEGKDKGVYDAIKFRKIIEENKDLRKKIEALEFELTKEKQISQNKMLNMESNLGKIGVLSSKVAKLHDLRSEAFEQLKMQKSLNEIKTKELAQKITFLNSENSLLKIKLEKVIEGVKHLKKYMYESMTPEEKNLDQQKLSNLDKVISNISQNLINVKKEFQTKNLEFNKNAVKKIEKLSSDLEILVVKSIKNKEKGKNVLTDYEELEKLKEEAKRLRKENAEFLEKIKASEEIVEKQITDVDIDQSLLKNIDVDRVNNVLQKSLDLIMLNMKNEK